jgi:hypothetical protein
MAAGLPVRGQNLLDAWSQSRVALQAAQDALNAAAHDESVARNRFGQWVLPDDARPMEKMSVVNGKTMIEVYQGSDGDCSINVRSREKADNA